MFHMARAFGVGISTPGLLEQLPLRRDRPRRSPRSATGRADLDRRAGVHALQRGPRPGRPRGGCCGSADRPNGGLIVDVWHWARAGTTAADLDPVPADRIVSVQLCDVLEDPMEPLRAESLGHRLPPGQGYGDAVGLRPRAADQGGPTRACWPSR